MNKSAASAASLDYVKFEAVIKSAGSAASLRGGRASGRLDHGFFCAIFGRASGQKIQKILKISRLEILPALTPPCLGGHRDKPSMTALPTAGSDCTCVSLQMR